jgi:branched-chain amino acid transport system permease protein
VIRLLQAVLGGLLTGGVYALAGAGLSLIFGVLRVINFAQGELVMIGMYLAWILFMSFHLDPFLALVLVMPVLYLTGYLMERFLLDRMHGALPQNQILLTMGLGLVLSNSAMLAFSADYRILTTSYSSSSFHLGHIWLSTPLAVSFVITAGIAAALWFFLSRTDTGLAVRATAQDRDAAQLMGVDVRRMSRLAFGLGAALAGAAGALVAPTYYIFPQVGGSFTLKAFVVVVLGGLGSVVGAMLGGLIIGTAESLAATYVSSELKDLCVYVLFLVVLLVKPAGLLGKSAA